MIYHVNTLEGFSIMRLTVLDALIHMRNACRRGNESVAWDMLMHQEIYNPEAKTDWENTLDCWIFSWSEDVDQRKWDQPLIEVVDRMIRYQVNMMEG